LAWLSLRLAADGEQAESWSDALLDAGALSVGIEDRDAGTEREEAQFAEPGEGDPHAWQRNWVVALLPAETDVADFLASAGVPADCERQLDIVEEQDWVRLTQAQFEPIRISGRLWIVPSWHAIPDTAAIGIVLDPGLAFGTGSHPTTRLCLQWLDANIRGGETVLDYGCGSGILAIAAARLGAAEVVGIDIDPQAVGAARDNALRNGVTGVFALPDALRGGRYDILVANILTNPLLALAPLFAERVRPGGRLVLSGILETQAETVMTVYGGAFTMRVWSVDDGWVCLEGQRC
jgi:ribosomal protein L11 methyltransferase